MKAPWIVSADRRDRRPELYQYRPRMNSSRPDYYALLGVEPDADSEAIRTAFRALAKQHHPDTSEAASPESTELFIRIQEAYDVVGDPERRAQYDRECALRAAALQHAEQLQREFDALQAKAGPQPPPGPPPRPGIFTKHRLFFLAAVLLVAGALSFVVYQQHQRSLQEQITVVRVDPPRSQVDATGRDRGGGYPPDLGVLAKEMERLSRLQVERVEAAKKRLEDEIEKAERKYAAATAKPAAPAAPAERPAKVDCAGEGRSFVLTRDNNTVHVSFNGAPPEQPAIQDLGTGIVMVSGFEPTKRLALGFMKGDMHGTVVLIFDATGKLFRTFGVDCTAAAF